MVFIGSLDFNSSAPANSSSSAASLKLLPIHTNVLPWIRTSLARNVELAQANGADQVELLQR